MTFQLLKQHEEIKTARLEKRVLKKFSSDPQYMQGIAKITCILINFSLFLRTNYIYSTSVDYLKNIRRIFIKIMDYDPNAEIF